MIDFPTIVRYTEMLVELDTAHAGWQIAPGFERDGYIEDYGDKEWIYALNMNDVFGFACAEDYPITFEEIPLVYNEWKSGDNDMTSLVKWVAIRTNQKPIFPVTEMMRLSGMNMDWLTKIEETRDEI